MINAIAELGKYEKVNDPNIRTNFDIWLEDSYDELNYSHLILIEFKKEKNEEKEKLFNNNWKWVFSKVDYREHSSNLKSKLLYKRGSSRGTDKTPTCKTANNIIGSYHQKIKSWFLNNQNVTFIDENAKRFIQMIHSELESKSDEITTQIKEKSENLASGGVVLTIVFVENGEQKFIGDYNFFSKFITEESKVDYRYSKTFKKTSFSEDQLCSICNMNKAEVYGYFTSLKFYNVDKPGMVTGGFDQSKSWKNYPICLDCALDIELGITMMDNNLKFNFYGLRYYLIPKTTNEKGKEDIIEEIITYKKSQRINDKDRLRITNAEDDVFDLLQKQKNNVTFNLLFFDKPQKSVFRILASIEDVLPSRIKQLFETKEFVDNMIFFKEYKEGKQMFRFNFGVLRTFFPNSKIEGNQDKFFLELTQKIFNDTKIDYQFIIQQIIYYLRNCFVNDQFFWFDSIKSFMLINFLNKLNLFRLKSKENEMDRQFYESFEIKSKEELESKVELFFENFKEFYLGDMHRSIFLVGVLSQFLLNIQQRERGATPFRSKLKGLKMDGRDITALVPEIIEKLEQYKSNYYIPLENLISKYLISAGDFRKWNIAIDEMNFIFVLGMNLSKYFKIKSEEIKEEY
ncbi:MAG TPA: TIGR02556 family CRISPR-associated protein [Candidatus Cloacimonetes bacterium]|nr:TIGR02556 family CRISPR-associated protein [Candidatus Cloacimonadota bacterium]